MIMNVHKLISPLRNTVTLKTDSNGKNEDDRTFDAQYSALRTIEAFAKMDTHGNSTPEWDLFIEEMKSQGLLSK